MKKVLYLSHIPWGWIKQRPHFLAEGMAKDFEVDYYFFQGRSHKASDDYTSHSIDKDLHLRLYTYWLFPFRWIPILKNLRFLETINWWYMRRQLPSFEEYDIVWITSPLLYPKIRSSLKKRNTLIYDCMDDMAAFPDVKDNKRKVKTVIEAERNILKAKNSIVLCSADYLAKTVSKRAGLNKNIIVVNNAIKLPKEKTALKIADMPTDVREKYNTLTGLSNVFMYIGTISEWIDFEKLEKLTKDFPDLNVVLIGPHGTIQIPNNPQIHALGGINRDYIFAFMEKATALIMPFEVNALIESVNPVKLYEYIYSGKPSLAPYYSESAKFGDFVGLYKDYDGLKQYTSDVLRGKYPTKSKESIADFIKANTWEKRMEQIGSAIKGKVENE